MTGVVAAALLFLCALALAAHGLAGRTATSAALTATRFPTATATPVHTATPAQRMVAAVTYEGSRIFGRTADGTVLWTYQVDGKDGRIVAVSGIEHGVMYVGTEKGVVYALRASDGAVIARSQPAQGDGGDGGDGGRDGGD